LFVESVLNMLNWGLVRPEKSRNRRQHTEQRRGRLSQQGAACGCWLQLLPGNADVAAGLPWCTLCLPPLNVHVISFASLPPSLPVLQAKTKELKSSFNDQFAAVHE
jgi:hypothetical protein